MAKTSERYHLKHKIGISGAAETGHCAPDAADKAELLGREIAKAGLVLVTGATTGIPYWAAKGAKAEGGIVIGISPAKSYADHLKRYHLPIDYHDLIIYTGFDYSGRNLLFTRSVDAVITICGRMGTLNEFTIAYEDEKPIGVLAKTGGTADIVSEIVDRAHKPMKNLVYDDNPKMLLDKVMKVVERLEAENSK